MDFKQRIAEATQYRDQTRDSYNLAKSETKQSQATYDRSFAAAPTYDSIYKNTKEQYYDTEEIAEARSSWETAKESVETVRTMIDKLPQSINQQFGGTSLTQAQRDLAKQKEMQQLSGSFQQYDANYQVSFANYNDMVDRAFDESMDVANKEYDGYWDGVKRKFNLWQDKISNEKEWNKLYNTSQSQLSQVQSDYRVHQIQQDTLRLQREFVQWQNDFAAMQRNQARDTAQYMRDYRKSAADKEAARDQRWKNDVAAFQSGKMSSAEFGRRMDRGDYR